MTTVLRSEGVQADPGKIEKLKNNQDLRTLKRYGPSLALSINTGIFSKVTRSIIDVMATLTDKRSRSPSTKHYAQ